MKKIQLSLEEFVVFCKEKGFVYNASSIYGGTQGVYDFGPLGVELKNNIKKAWWESMVYMRDDVFGYDGSIILNKKVVYYSGHQDNFCDVYVDCKDCKIRVKNEDISEVCQNCKSKNLTKPTHFNLMMNVNLGATGTDYGVLRPETSQSMFINFKNVVSSMGAKIPFGIAQIGKSFRNEVTTRHFIFRSREFEQMEMIFLIEPKTNKHWFNYWVKERVKWWKEQGVNAEEFLKTDLAHYAAANVDLLFNFIDSKQELEGIHDRLDYDLGTHSKDQASLQIESKSIINNADSTEKLNYFNGETRFVPNIIEVSAGAERAFLAIMLNSFYVDVKQDGQERMLLKLPFHLAPVKIAVIPLMKNNAELVEKAKEITQLLKKHKIFPVQLEITNNIGRTYKYHDEIGTPFCVTVDFESLKDNSITVRSRDSALQTRVKISELTSWIENETN